MPTTCQHCLAERYANGRFEVGGELYLESNLATVTLRDFVADWPDQTYAGRIEAVKAWKGLRRQRAVLRRMYGEECP